MLRLKPVGSASSHAIVSSPTRGHASSLCALSSWGLIALGVGCAQPSQEQRRPYSPPPPDPIINDASFDPEDEGEEDEGEEPEDDASSDEGTQPDGSAPRDAGGSPPGEDAATPGADAGPVSCAAPQTQCGDSCVDLTTSAAHCGGCGHKCPGGAACGGGTCASPSADCMYAQREGHDYLFCSNKLTWEGAREACQDFGLDLVMIADQAENDFVQGAESRWIGATNTRSNPFRWIVPGGDKDGPDVTFTAWDKNEPNDDDRDCLIPIPGFPLACTYEDCAELKANGKWNDAYCNKKDTTRAYACESY